MRRPNDWDRMTPKEQMQWLNKQRIQLQGGPKRRLKEKDKEKVWELMRTYQNKSIVAQLLGVSRRTVIRFLNKFPIPLDASFEVKHNVEEYPEIKMWIRRQKAFCKESVLHGYLVKIRKFHNYMKENHPEGQRPRLWTSDDVLEWVQLHEPYQQHDAITPLRQLANKCPKEFPMIDLGLLPTRKTHRAKRSLAGKREYYLTIDQIRRMIDACDKVRDKAIISLLFNTGCRTGNAKKGLGLAGIKIENLSLDAHTLRMKDKGEIIWNVMGLSDQTCEYIRQYLEERENPTSGFLFVNGHGTPMSNTQINRVIKEVGKHAEIEGRRLVAKTFRKSLVKYALEECGMNPGSLIGTGKQTKTCFCVGWSDMKVLMQHYAPHLEKQIEADRQKFKL